MSSGKVCFASAHLGNHWGFPLNICSLLGFLPPAFLDSWILSMCWEVLQDDLGEKRNQLQPTGGNARWCGGEGLGYSTQEELSAREERASDPKGQEMAWTLELTCSVPFLIPSLRLNFTSAKCRSSPRALLWKHSHVLLEDPFQNVTPVHNDFANSILIKYILHSDLKCLWPRWRQLLFDWSPCLHLPPIFLFTSAKMTFLSWKSDYGSPVITKKKSKWMIHLRPCKNLSSLSSFNLRSHDFPL